MTRIAAILLFVLSTLGPVSAEVIRITSAGSSLEGRPLMVDREFGGHVGDHIQLVDGEYKLSLSYEHEYTLYFHVVVSEGNVEVRDFRGSRFDDCINNKVSPFELLPWPKGTLSSDSSGVFTLTLAAPGFRNRGDQGECMSQPSLASLNVLGGASLTIASKPQGATVFVGEDKIGTTDLVRVVPYKRGNRDLRIVFRHPGYANCLRSIRLPEKGDLEATVECTLLKISRP